MAGPPIFSGILLNVCNAINFVPLSVMTSSCTYLLNFLKRDLVVYWARINMFLVHMNWQNKGTKLNTMDTRIFLIPKNKALSYLLYIYIVGLICIAINMTSEAYSGTNRPIANPRYFCADYAMEDRLFICWMMTTELVPLSCKIFFLCYARYFKTSYVFPFYFLIPISKHSRSLKNTSR